jgi:hypothetical protein
MAWHLIVRPRVSAAIGACGLSRDALLFVFSSLYYTLPENADRFRRVRDPDLPDRCFLFRLGFAEGSVWHRLEFSVDDATAPERLFVEKLVHFIQPLP